MYQEHVIQADRVVTDTIAGEPTKNQGLKVESLLRIVGTTGRAIQFDNGAVLQDDGSGFLTLKGGPSGVRILNVAGSQAVLQVSDVGAVTGAVNRAASNGATGFQPTAISGDRIVDFMTLGAGYLTTPRGVKITIMATHAANTQVMNVKINLGGTGALNAVVSGGDTVANVTLNVSGGLSIIEVTLFGTGASTQLAYSESITNATQGTVARATGAQTAANALQLNLIMNAATATTDATVEYWTVQPL